MKIKKNKLLEKVLIEADEDDLSNLDPSKASVKEIADGIQDSMDEISDGDQVISDAEAVAAAKEVKQASDELHAAYLALDPGVAEDAEEYIGVENRLTRILDKALKANLRNKKQHRKADKNVMITGLPGSAKTATTYDWIKGIFKKTGISIYIREIRTSDPDLESAVYGITMRDLNAKETELTKGATKFLNDLDCKQIDPSTGKPYDYAILFLDEFNRANDSLRAAIMSLVNEHKVPDIRYPGGVRYFNKLLFTVAVMNPPGPWDTGARELPLPEPDRFHWTEDKLDSDTETTIDYLTKYYNKLIEKLDPNDPDYEENLEFYLRAQDFGIYVVSDYRFAYDNRDDLLPLIKQKKRILTHRGFCRAIDADGDDKNEFIDWVENNSNYLDKDKEMLIEIANTYNPPSLKDLIQAKKAIIPKSNTSKTDDQTEDQPDEEETTSTDLDDDTITSDTDDFDALDDDDDSFKSAAPGKTTVSKQTVEDIIKNNMNNWNW